MAASLGACMVGSIFQAFGSSDVVINEIHYDPADNTSPVEFVELYNATGSSIDISGWRLDDAVDFTIPSGTVIPGSGFVVIAENPSALALVHPVPPGVVVLGPYSGKLSSDGETVRLLNQIGSEIDKVDYSVGFPWPVSPAGEGPSMELIKPSLDNDLGSSWRGHSGSHIFDWGAQGWHWRPGSSEASSPVHVWRNHDFVQDGSWTQVQLPIGYGVVSGLTFNTSISGMRFNYSSVFLRKTFELAAGNIPDQLIANYIADDGAVIWINGVEVANRTRVDAGPVSVNTLANALADPEGERETRVISNASSFLRAGTNVIAVQVFNQNLGSSDIGFDLELRRSGGPTPGKLNSVPNASIPPNIRQVQHVPQTPAANTATVITAKVTDPDGVASVVCRYQVVAPGSYIPSHLPNAIVSNDISTADRVLNPGYTNPASWESVSMVDDGTNGDTAAGDGVYSCSLPGQAHRTLVRYTITVTDSQGASAVVPYEDDSARNFAYFVYNGVPDYMGHTSATLTQLPVYHLLTRHADWTECRAYDSSDQITQGNEGRFVYNWSGTLVYDGVVYDNIRYRLRGANGRYLGTGKRSMRFRMNKGSYFQARDQEGNKYPRKWRTLTTGKQFENRMTLTYGLNEAVNMYAWNKLGLPGSHTHWFHFRLIDGASEFVDQYNGDFQGLNFALETYDVRFLESHDLEKGNLYKLINQTTDAVRQRRYQAPNGVTDGSDHDNIENNLTGSRSASYIGAHVNLEKYYLFHGLSEAVRHYDFWPSANKNMVYYFEPDYQSANSNYGKLWLLPWDTDASWGPTWNSGHDVVYNSLFDASGPGSDNQTTSALWPDYFNTIREIRDLLWQTDQIYPLIDEFAAFITPLEAADASRWKGAPSSEGNYSGLGGAGATTIANLVQDMKNFAFVGGAWPGGDVGSGGRAAHLDALQASHGEGTKIPITPTISYSGVAGFPTTGLQFTSSSFSDPQGNGTFSAMEWRVAEVTDPSAPGHDASERFKLEWNASWESGELNVFQATQAFPVTSVRSGRTYRARVRHKDNTGRWSHWSAPVQFTVTAPDISEFTNHLVITEFMYHPVDPSVAEAQAGFTSENFEYIELQNIGSQTLDLSAIRLTKGVDFDFAGSQVTTLAPSAYVLIVSNKAAFEMRYGTGLPVAGEWENGDKLSNGGERLKVSFGLGDTVRDLTYDDTAPWPVEADGLGASLVLRRPFTNPDHALAASWKARALNTGNPGGVDSTVFTGIANADNDGDGANAFLEYAVGTSDLDGSSLGSVQLSLIEPAGHIEFTVGQNILADDLTRSMEMSTDLSNWTPLSQLTVVSQTVLGNGRVLTRYRSVLPVADGVSRLFIREVIQPL